MKQRCDELSLFVPEEKWHDIKFQGDCIVFGDELTCRDLIIEGDFVLVGNLFCNVIDIKGNCTIYGSILSCAKVTVQGNLNVYAISQSINQINGGFLASDGDIEIDGDLICDHRIRAGKSKIKVKGDIITRDLECRAISVAGNCFIYPGTIDSTETVYVLGNVTTGRLAIDAIELYCGGKYTHKLNCEKETAIIHEDFKHWSN